MKPKKINMLGMELDQWSYKSCIAHFGTGTDWATLYHIESKVKNKGHATKLLTQAKQYYEALNKEFMSTVALNDSMEHVLNKFNIYKCI